jgi:predicted protein tyrosine phosphatase
MRFLVYSRDLVEKGIVKDIQDCYPDAIVGVISIAGTKPNCISDDVVQVIHKEKNFFGICRMNFDDVDRDVDGTKGWIIEHGYSEITNEQANNIVDFILAAKVKNVDIMIVHCEAGISRSSATAAACSVILGQSDAEYFGNARYNPNMKVYRSILNAYQGR